MKGKKIGYWVTTGLVCLAVLGSGFAKVTGNAEIVENMTRLGYPAYFTTLLGVWYLLAVPGLLSPFAALRDWAYAGVFFAMTGALISHISMGDPMAQNAPIFVIMALLVASRVLSTEVRAPKASENASKGLVGAAAPDFT